MRILYTLEEDIAELEKQERHFLDVALIVDCVVEYLPAYVNEISPIRCDNMNMEPELGLAAIRIINKIIDFLDKQCSSSRFLYYRRSGCVCTRHGQNILMRFGHGGIGKSYH